jgi:hypothetical protein
MLGRFWFLRYNLVMKEFSGLDGKGFDNRPITRRKEATAQTLTVESVFDLAAFTKEDGSFDNELVAVERYAFSSFLIEAMWENLKQREMHTSTEGSPVIPIGEDFWKQFADHYIQIVQEEKDVLDKNAELSLKKSGKDMTFTELATLRYMYLVKATTGERGLPSFIDFISIYTRLARVVEELGGEQMTREQFEQALAHSSFRNMMLEMMMNSRDAGLYQLSVLEGQRGIPDTDDTSRKFNSSLFSVEGDVETGDFHIAPDSDMHARVKQYVNDLFKMKQADGTAPPVFRCPVIYTGTFTEMCDWMRHEFTHHYLNQRFD